MKHFIGELMTQEYSHPEFGQRGDVFKIVDIHFNDKHIPIEFVLKSYSNKSDFSITIKKEDLKRMFRPTRNNISIYFNDKYTTAEWFNPENGGYESATSRCRPTDKYDMETGAHIAIGRLMHKKSVAKMTKEELVDYLYSNFYNVETNTIDISHLDFSKFQCNLNIGWCKANQIQQSGQTAKYVSQKNIHAEHLFQDEQKKEVK